MSAARKKEAPPATSILPRFRIYQGKTVVLGPGKAELLQHIEETGSISEAARRMGMSYNRAWLHVKVMNDSFKEPLVLSARGGSAGGGASLTETGRQVLESYRDMEQRAAEATKAAGAALLKLLQC